MLPALVLLLQVFSAAFLYKHAVNQPSSNARCSITVLVPAHNESLVIAETIKSILPQLTSADQLLIVADNCSDDTAAKSSGIGAIVIERENLQLRGKGYALDFGLQWLKQNPPQMIVIVDADCVVAPNAIAILANACVNYQRPIQALYLMKSQPKPSLKERIAEFAWVVKNLVRPLGFNALGLPCQLMGTGMAFLWGDISKADLANGHIVEDMKLGVDLTRLNKAPLFLPDALVTSVFPLTYEAANSQRTRWEHGHLSVIVNEAPRLFFEAIKQGNWQMLGLAFDLIVPPIAILAMLCVVVWVVSLFLANKLVLFMASILLGVLVLSIILSWIYFGRNIISLKQLCYAPIYALTKIPLYIKFFLNRQVEWVRSKRD